jgi:hypothetical protein
MFSFTALEPYFLIVVHSLYRELNGRAPQSVPAEICWTIPSMKEDVTTVVSFAARMSRSWYTYIHSFIYIYIYTFFIYTLTNIWRRRETLRTKAITQTAGRGIRNRRIHYKHDTAIKLLLIINSNNNYLLMIIIMIYYYYSLYHHHNHHNNRFAG